MVQKMAQKHSNKKAAEQISQMIVDLVKKKVLIHYHLNPGEFAPRIETIDKSELQNRITENNKNVENPEKDQKNREINQLEKDCF